MFMARPCVQHTCMLSFTGAGVCDGFQSHELMRMTVCILVDALSHLDKCSFGLPVSSTARRIKSCQVGMHTGRTTIARRYAELHVSSNWVERNEYVHIRGLGAHRFEVERLDTGLHTLLTRKQCYLRCLQFC